MRETAEEKTRVQLQSVILIACLNQCNDEGLPREAYQARLNELLRERGAPDMPLELIEQLVAEA